MDQQRVAAYLERIGLAAEPPTADYLRRLQLRHLQSVPFESLSIHLGEPIVLDLDRLFEKVVTRRRGGFCYELNGLFAELLTSLGYDITLHSASVLLGPEPGPPFDHLVLRAVADDGRQWLVDVGFGDFTHYPLRWDERGEQEDPSGTYHIEDQQDTDLLVRKDDQAIYRLELRPRTLRDCVPTCWWQQTSPDSHFTRSSVCTILTENGRDTISNRTLIETRDGQRHETKLADDDELRKLYSERFGVVLDRLPAR